MSISSSIRYAAIGDSITVGVGALFNYGYAYQYRDFIRQDLKRTISIRNLGKIGWTSKELRNSMQQNQLISNSIKEADVITSIGGNDLIQASKDFYRNKNPIVFETAFINFKRNFRLIHREIKRLKGLYRKPYILRYIDIYNPLPELELAVIWVQRFNRIIHSVSGKHTKIAPVYNTYLGRENELLFIDREHPNQKGHRVIALEVRKLGYRPLA